MNSLIKVVKVFSLVLLIIPQLRAQTATWNPSGSKTGLFYNNLQEKNWYNPANWTWSGTPPPPANGIPDINTAVVIPNNTAVCWIPPNNASYCIDAITNPASPVLGNAPCSGNYVQATDPLAASITISGGAIYNQAGSGAGSPVSLRVAGNVTITNGGGDDGVLMIETPVTKIDGSLHIENNGHFVIFSGEIQVELKQDIKINGTITKLQTNSNGIFTINFLGSSNSSITGTNKSNVSTSAPALAPYLNFNRFTSGAFDNVLVNKEVFQGQDYYVDNADGGMPFLSGVVDGSGNLILSSTGSFTINKGTVRVNNAITTYQTFTGADNWTWRINDPDINIRGKLFIANADVGTVSYKGASLDLWRSDLSNKEDITMHLGGSLEDLNVYYPSETDNGQSRGGLYIGSITPSSWSNQSRPVIVFNGSSDQDIRGLNGNGTSDQLKNFAGNASEGVGLVLPNVIYNPSTSTKTLTINASNNLRIIGHLLVTQGTFSLNSRKFLFGDKASGTQYSSNVTSYNYGDEINVYGTFEPTPSSTLKMSTGGTSYGTMLRIRQGGTIKSVGTANQNVNITRDGVPGNYYRIAAYSGTTVRVVYTLFELISGSNTGYAIPNTNSTNDNTSGGTHSSGGFKCYEGSTLATDIDHDLDATTAVVPSFSYCSMISGGFYLSFITINTGQTLQIDYLSVGDPNNPICLTSGCTPVFRNIVANNGGSYTITLNKSSGTSGGINVGEYQDGGGDDAKIIWTGPTPIYWLGPEGISMASSVTPAATYKNNTSYFRKWSDSNADGTPDNLGWSLSPTSYVPIDADPSKIPGTGSFTNFDIYVPSTCSRHLLIDQDYTLDGGYFFLEYFASTNFRDGGNVRHRRQYRRATYLEDGVTLTLGGDFSNGGSNSYSYLGGEFTAGTNSNLNVAGSFYSNSGRGYQGEVASSLFYALTGSTVKLNGTENQNLGLRTNALYNLTIEKNSGTVINQGLSGATYYSQVIKNKFSVIKGNFVIRSTCPLVIQGDYEQQGGSVDFDLSPITVQGNFKVTGGSLVPTSSIVYFTPNTATDRVIQLDGSNVKLNKVIFNRSSYIPTAGHNSSTNYLYYQTYQASNPVTTVTSNIVNYAISSNTNTFEVLNDVIIESNRRVTLGEDLVATTGNITIQDEGVLNTSAGTEFQIRAAQTLQVEDGGTLNAIGSVSKYTKISRMGTGNDAYSFKVDGTLKARYYLIEFTDVDGVNLGSSASTLSPGVTIVGGGGENYSTSTVATVVGGGGIGATATANITASITKINVTNQGGGYIAVPTLSIDAPGGSGTQATATAIIKGPVTGMYMTNGGEYTVLPTTVTFTPATANGSGASGIVKAGVKNISLTNAGAKYSSAPTVQFSNGGGSGATASTKLSAEVVSYKVTNGGAGYTTVPGAGDVTLDHTGTNNTGNATVTGVTCTVTGAKDIVGGNNYDNTATVTIVGGTYTTQATAIPIISGGQLTGISITSPGSGYTVAPTSITINPGSSSGTGASCTPVLSIESLTLGAGGSGYETAPAISLPDPPSASDISTITASVVANLSGTVKSIAVDNAGQGYTSVPTISILPPGATASATVASGQVQSVSIDQGGAYYSTPPTVSFSTGTATAYSVIEDGVVTQIVVTDGGSGYASAPEVTLSLPSGSAQATASLTMTINEITLSSGGQNYDSPPAIGLTGGTVVGGDNATVQATMSVQSISITNAGTEYATLPNIVIQAPEPAVGIGTANGAIQALATAETVGEITSISVSNSGADYTGTPYVIITDPSGNGRGAAAEAVLNNTTVSHVTVIDGGHYTMTPSISFSGGLGTGGTSATATVTMVAPGFNEISKASIVAKGSGCTDGTYDINVTGGSSTATVLITVVENVVASAKVKTYGLGYGSDVDISSLINQAVGSGGCGCSGANVTALAGSRISTINVTGPGNIYTGTPNVTITPQGGDTNGGDGAAIAYLNKTTLNSIVLTTKNVYPAATFSDGIFTNGYNRDNAGGSVNGVFITFPNNYSVYRNNSNDYSTIESLPASVGHNYSTTPVVDTIYNVIFPQNPTRITNPFNSNNVRRNGSGNSALNNVVFKDALGTFSGEDYDDEQGSNDNVIWVEPNIVRWDGGPSNAGTAWSNPNNWRPNGVPTPDKHVIIDYQLMALQFNNPAGPGTVIAPSNYVVDMDLDPAAYPIACRSLTIETLIPGLNPSNSRGSIALELTKPLTVLESFSASEGTTIEVKNSTATISIGGSWSNEGKFIHGLGTVEFNQPLTRTINAASGIVESYSQAVSHTTTAAVGQTDEHANAFYNLILSDGTTELNSYIRVENDLTIKNSGTRLNPSNSNFTIELWGKWQNEGTFDAKAGKVIFASNLSQTVGKGFRTLAEATTTLTGVTVGTISLTSGKEGEKYAVAPQVIIEGGGGYGATATATIDSDGKINSLTLNTPGTAYTSPPTVSFAPIDKEDFYNVDVFKSANHVTLLTRTEISNSLDFRANNIIADTLRECIVGGNVTATNGYVDGSMGRIYNSTAPTTQVYSIGKGTQYPGDVSLNLTLNGTPASGDAGKALYIIERFNGLPVTGRVIPTAADVSVLLDAHYRAYQAPYPYINSSYPKNNTNTDLDFTSGKIGIPLSLTTETLTTKALAGATISLSSIAVANLDNYRILMDAGDGSPVNTSDPAKGLDLEVPYHTPGTNWVNIGGDNTVNANIGGATIISSISSFTQLGSGTFSLGIKYTALPVDFVTLEATPQGRKVALNWTSFAEKDLTHYEVERSLDGENFSKIANQPAAGNSVLSHNYNMTDHTPKNGLNYYRLKIYDKDNKFRHSQVVSAQITADAGFSVYPNPNDGTYARITSKVALPNEDIAVVIRDISGKVVARRLITATERTSSNTIELKSLGLNSGLHFIHLEGESLKSKLKLMINK